MILSSMRKNRFYLQNVANRLIRSLKFLDAAPDKDETDDTDNEDKNPYYNKSPAYDGRHQGWDKVDQPCSRGQKRKGRPNIGQNRPFVG